MQKIYLVCGVPGSGKSWVCNQLSEKFEYIANDDFIGKDYLKELFAAARRSEKPILADCPFAERKVREELEAMRLKVIPYFIVESPQVVKQRYEKREGRPVEKNTISRAMSIKGRAEEWNAPHGTSSQVLELLKAVSV